jgi:hypothetical protein
MICSGQIILVAFTASVRNKFHAGQTKTISGTGFFACEVLPEGESDMSYIDPDQLHGVLNDFIAFVQDTDNAAALTAAGTNPTTVQTNLTNVQSDLDGKKQARDKQKTMLKTTQDAFAGSASANYTAFSNAVDAVSGALGKTTPAGQQVLGYRKKLNAAPQHHASSTPAATPHV